ncbi:hypothetical protein LCGC14_2313490, partial [marine sediment metagenome]
MQHRRYKALGIVSAKKPQTTHLWWETDAGGLYLVDSADNTKIYYSSDKGANWTQIDVDPSDSSGDNKSRDHNIRVAFHDRDNKIIWFVDCDNDGTADDFDVWKLDYSASESAPTTTEIGTSAAPDANTVYVYDIWVFDGNTYVLNQEDRTGDQKIVHWDVDTAPFVEKQVQNALNIANNRLIFGMKDADSLNKFWAFEDGGTVLYFLNGSADGSIGMSRSGLQSAGVYGIPTALNLQGVSYDNINTIYFIVKKIADGNPYLARYDFDGGNTVIGEPHNISLMLDRNNSAIIPNEVEKAFGISNKIIYEIRLRGSGVRQLQDLSAQLSGNIVAITDNFLLAINNGTWDVYEFTEVSNEIDEIEYNYGIIGIPQVGFFIAHPDFQANWNKGDSIKIYDQFDALEFWGIIKDKNRDERGFYVFDIDAFSNEVYRVQYDKDYSADDLDTKQKDIIDNKCDFCYRSSSIVGTTTTFDY